MATTTINGMNGRAENDPQPVWLWIDPTRDCNLKCKLCYAVPSHRSEHLSPERLRFFLSQVFEDRRFVVQKLHLNWRGDPAMNPQLPALLREVESLAPYFPWELHTNGTLINPSLAKEITSKVKTGQIFVSVDGGNASSHDGNRGEGTFCKALSGLRELLHARGSAEFPKIGIFQLDLGEDPSQYDPEFSILASKVDVWAAVSPAHPRNGKRLNSHSPARPRVINVESGVTREAESRWWTIGPADASTNRACFWAGNAFFVAPDGDVSICLFSHSPDGIIGNLLKQSFAEIVAQGRAFRAKLADSGRSSVAHCSQCRMESGEPMPLILRHPSSNEGLPRPKVC
jgi:radical SAM protein with 4Fe4S-binding SPASM domain